MYFSTPSCHACRGGGQFSWGQRRRWCILPDTTFDGELAGAVPLCSLPLLYVMSFKETSVFQFSFLHPLLSFWTLHNFNITPYYSSLLKLLFQSHRKRRKEGKNQDRNCNFLYFFKEIKICIHKKNLLKNHLSALRRWHLRVTGISVMCSHLET